MIAHQGFEAEQGQLELFEQRFPRKPYCTDDLSDGLSIRPRKTAFGRRYIQANPPTLRFWMIHDVDREQAALAWEDAHLPEPSWTTVNTRNGHAHLAWGISAPVLTSDAARQKPLRYLAAVESAYRLALQADPGFSGLITKNPRHSTWRTFWGRTPFRDLGELADWVDLPKHLPKRGAKPEKVGLGRNCDLFEHLRHFAYKEVRGWKRAGGKGVFVYWQQHLYSAALDYTNLEHPQPLDHRECWHTAKSVAKWVWNRFDLEASDRRFSALQSARGARKGRGQREQLKPQAIELAGQGYSQRQIADRLGVARPTVQGWLRGG